MKTKHTPGPWVSGGQVVYAENKRTIAIFPDEECPALWNGGTHGGGFECSDCACREQEENAKLAASAPELLAALQEVELRTTQARIASGIGKNTKQHTISFLLSELARIADAARQAIQKAQGEA